MREHQIVVNLKAQQFEQLQKLARERGFKSVTAYVKQKVLELAMGLADDASGRPSSPSMSQAELVAMASSPAIGDLERIHSELKSFLDELSGPTELPSVPSSASSSFAGGGNFVGGFEVGLPDDDFGWSSAKAEPATSINVGAPQINFNLNADSHTASADGSSFGAGNSTYTSGAGSALGTPSSSAPSARESSSESGDAAPQVLPSSNLGGFGFGLGSFSSYGNSSTRFQTPFSASNDRLSGYRDIMDDMEELADRAFAISPRLGALDETVEANEPEEGGRGARRRSSENEIEKDDESGAVIANNDTSFVAPFSPADLPDINESDEAEEPKDSARDKKGDQLLSDIDEFFGGAAPVSFVPAVDVAAQDISTDVSADAGLSDNADFEANAEMARAEANAEAANAEIAHTETANTELVNTGAASAETELAEPRRTRRRSKTLFEEPMLPPPDDEERTPTFIPPPAPLPPRASYTNLNALAVPEAEASVSKEPEEPLEDDLLDDLLDGNLHAAAKSRREDEPNPFAVSLSFELEAQAQAQAEKDAAGSVYGGLADAVAGMASADGGTMSASASKSDSNSDSDSAFDAKADDTIDEKEKEDQSVSGTRPVAGAGGDSQGDGTNPSTFSGTPPPKRRRT